MRLLAQGMVARKGSGLENGPHLLSIYYHGVKIVKQRDIEISCLAIKMLGLCMYVPKK